MSTIGFLGAGKMGTAMLASLLRGGAAAPGEILACEALAERRGQLRRRYRVRVTDDPALLATGCEIVFLAVKPQDLDPLLGALAPALTRRHLLISIAAGKTLGRLRQLAGDRPRLARVMPNLPVMVGAGMLAYTLGAGARSGDRRLVARLLACCGQVVELEERHFDVVTALSGSGPAFYAYIMRALACAAERLDLPPEAARMLALQTMLGTARYLRETAQEPAAFIQAVASPRGTTAVGLKVLEKSALEAILFRTIAAAARRSRDLNG